MKRISRSLLSLCLALVLCAALLPVNVAKATGEGTTARTGTSFLITGYRASRSSIYTGDTVDITVYLSRTDGSNDSIRVVRGLDSFQDGTASAVASGQNGEYTVTFTGLTYTGDSGMDSTKCRAISIEVGMQNSGLATSLAAAHFAQYPLATIPGAVFSVWHNISGALLANFFARTAEKKD